MHTSVCVCCLMLSLSTPQTLVATQNRKLGIKTTTNEADGTYRLRLCITLAAVPLSSSLHYAYGELHTLKQDRNITEIINRFIINLVWLCLALTLSDALTQREISRRIKWGINHISSGPRVVLVWK